MGGMYIGHLWDVGPAVERSARSTHLSLWGMNFPVLGLKWALADTSRPLNSSSNREDAHGFHMAFDWVVRSRASCHFLVRHGGWFPLHVVISSEPNGLAKTCTTNGNSIVDGLPLMLLFAGMRSGARSPLHSVDVESVESTEDSHARLSWLPKFARK